MVARYREALSAIGAADTGRRAFHVDAAGYSPEIAAEQEDPFYLGVGMPDACAIVLSVEQLAAPLVHPGLGYAAAAFRAVTGDATREISGITLREPLIGEIHAAPTRLSEAHELADLSSFEVRFRTPGGLVAGARDLEQRKAEFLASGRLWLDDEFLDEIAGLALTVRELGQLSERFVASQHPLGPFYTAAFGGTYVLEESGQSSRKATTHVLATALGPGAKKSKRHSTRGRRIAARALDAQSAADLLLDHHIGRIDVRAEGEDGLEAIAHWIGVDHLLRHEPEWLASAEPADVDRRMRRDSSPPPAYLELESLRQRAGTGRKVPLDDLSASTRLRLVVPTSTREPVRRFAKHLRAGADPLHLERAWRDAPDVFFARLPSLDDALRAYFAGWLKSRARAQGVSRSSP